MKKGFMLFLFLALLMACARSGTRTEVPESPAERTSGLKRIDILAKGME